MFSFRRTIILNDLLYGVYDQNIMMLALVQSERQACPTGNGQYDDGKY